MELTQVDWRAYAAEQRQADNEFRRFVWRTNVFTALIAACSTILCLVALLFDMTGGAQLLCALWAASFARCTVFAVRTAQHFAPHDPRPR